MYVWIEDSAALDGWMAAHAATAIIGLDTEFMRTDTFRSRLALVQANVAGDIALIDVPALGACPALAARLRARDCICVMHSAGEDLDALASIVADGPQTLFDTQIAAALCGLGFGLSYQKLVALAFAIDLPKAETRSDWLRRPLSAAQLDYAAQDVAHLPQLHALLDAKLGALGRRDWLAEDCRRLVERVRHAQPDPQPQRAFRGASEWPPERQALLRRLLLWREDRARSLDKPRQWILDDARALEFVSRPPQSGEELFERSKGLRALRGPLRQEILELLRAPLQPADLDFAPIPRPMTNSDKRRVAAMRDAVAAIAATRDLPEGLLCPRRHLEALVTDGAWPAALEGWRKALLHEALMEILARAA